jgi:flagellar biosynthesis protein FlhA
MAGLAAEEAINPANGNKCSWIRSSDLKAAKEYADKHGVSYWRPFEYVVLHVASVFRYNALEFLRVDDVMRVMMSNWGLQELGVQVRGDGLLLELTQTLRALVADQFRVFYPESMVRAFRENYASAESLTMVVERMRTHPEVRKQNTYFQWAGESQLIRVGPRFEAAIEEGLRIGQGVVLALDPNIIQELLTTVKKFTAGLDNNGPSPYLLTSARLRPWVRKLIELEFPFFRVVSEPEVLPEGLLRVTRTLEYEEIRSASGS